MGAVKRPGGVTFIAVLVWISGLLDIIGGTILLFQTSVAATVESFGGASQLIASAIVSILIGVVVMIVAAGLLRGSSAARLVVTIIEVISIASSIFLAIAYPAGAIGEYLSAVISVIVIAMLWTRRASAFFRD
ncbi:hypothetical protein MUN74_12580 [Agromyces endophyticus]|uniref:DUF7144 family membrane protein n=1 Tax=Agromyces sp. H17E-10 TaxID=2932244 RepID=UPI001FD0847F|nr:hypothetical protein [Agromyces sp. H17E-10]UOQ88121.1 hypothetical protein MUN74_12580 [Agromyces sp. H17E-10]